MSHAVRSTHATEHRFLLGQVLPMASRLVERLSQLPDVQQATVCGQVRLAIETVSQLDLVLAVEPDDSAGVTQQIVKLVGPTAQVAEVGHHLIRLKTGQGLSIQAHLAKPGHLGAAMLWHTGPKEHLSLLQQRARSKGWQLAELGLFQSLEQCHSRTEKDIYQALDLAWIPPEARQGLDEIRKAESGSWPTLLDKRDLKADLHTHTTASDGKLSPLELVSLAADMGYHTIAITDHSVSQKQANGLTAQRLEKHIQHLRDLQKQFEGRLRILAGSEVDILADGKLDYPDSLLKELDIVIASPHDSLTQHSTRSTQRLLAAIEHPSVTIIGHPTGRLLNRRTGLSPDMAEVCKAAVKHDVALEINANPHRLDLRDSHARLALEHGVKLAINSDAHRAGDFDHSVFGVLTARRAGAVAKDIINTWPADQLTAWLNQRRSHRG